MRKEIPRRTVLYKGLRLFRGVARNSPLLRKILLFPYRMRIMNHEPMDGLLSRCQEYLATSTISAFADLALAASWETPYLLRDLDKGEKEAAAAFENILKDEPKIVRVWEIGCGVGSILYALAKRFPHIHFLGTELHRGHVTRLNEEMKTREAFNVTVIEAEKFLNRLACTYDMVCSRGVLCYVPPGPMVDLLEKIQAVDPKIVVLCEPSTIGGVEGWKPFANKLLYAYDFREIFKTMWPEAEIGELVWFPGKSPAIIIRRKR